MTYEQLITECSSFLRIDSSLLTRFQKYLSLVQEKNESMNLTAITKTEEMIEKHLYDCLLALKPLQNISYEKALDVGSGAGFPGVVLSLASPNKKWTLLEATGKKCHFLEEVKKTLEMSNLDVIHARAEELKARNSFDLVTARAVASLPILLELSLPLVREGGYFLALKGSSGEQELEQSKHALQVLGGEVVSLFKEVLPYEGSARVNILIRKTNHTPKKYPRLYSEIKTKPL